MQPKLEELRRFVALKQLESPSRQMVAGEDFQKMHRAADAIPEPDLRKRVQAEMGIRPKYQTLHLLLSDDHELMKKYPDVALAIARAGSDLDYVAAHYPPAV